MVCSVLGEEAAALAKNLHLVGNKKRLYTTPMIDIATHLIWLDLEMTGLHPDQDKILEIATVVTTKNLELIAEGPVFAIYQTETVLQSMVPWGKKQHAQSGLLSRVRQSHVNEAMAEEETLAFLQKHVVPKTSPMCGNSICQDRRFLARYMPRLEQFFHYRHLDVSTIKIVAQSWFPSLPPFPKLSRHVALSDVHESISELQYYRSHLFSRPHPVVE